VVVADGGRRCGEVTPRQRAGPEGRSTPKEEEAERRPEVAAVYDETAAEMCCGGNVRRTLDGPYVALVNIQQHNVCD
jgi:hypothetical protein